MDAADLTALELALPVGAEHGTTEAALAQALGWPDTRKVREGIQELRRGAPGRRSLAIVALTKPGGVYVLPDGADISGLKRTRDSLRSRAMSLLVTVHDLDLLIADREWQPTLFREEAS